MITRQLLPCRRLLVRRAHQLEAQHNLPAWNSTRPHTAGPARALSRTFTQTFTQNATTTATASSAQPGASPAPPSAQPSVLPAAPSLQQQPHGLLGQSLEAMDAQLAGARQSLHMGTAELSLASQPPAVIRETLPIPACPFAGVKATMKGIQVGTGR